MKHLRKKNKKTTKATEDQGIGVSAGNATVKTEIPATKAASSFGGHQKPSRRRPQMTRAPTQATSVCEPMQVVSQPRNKRRTASDVWTGGASVAKMEQK